MMLHDAQPTSRREQAKGGRRSRIVDATYTLLREVGIDDLSVKMIADQAGVSPATVYNLFGTKAAVLEKVYERDLADFEQRIVQTPSTDSLDRIFDCVAITAAHYRSDPRFYRSVSKMPNKDPADAELIDVVTSSRSSFWGDLVRAAAADGWLRSDCETGRLGAAMNYLASGAVGAWVSNLISIDRYERDVSYGFAILLWSAATKAAQQRLQARLDAGAAPAPTRRRAKVSAE
jgi:AcrR family transcriptional regulator